MKNFTKVEVDDFKNKKTYNLLSPLTLKTKDYTLLNFTFYFCETDTSLDLILEVEVNDVALMVGGGAFNLRDTALYFSMGGDVIERKFNSKDEWHSVALKEDPVSRGRCHFWKTKANFSLPEMINLMACENLKIRYYHVEGYIDFENIFVEEFQASLAQLHLEATGSQNFKAIAQKYQSIREGEKIAKQLILEAEQYTKTVEKNPSPELLIGASEAQVSKTATEVVIEESKSRRNGMRFSDWIKFLMWWLGGAFILIYQFPVLIKWLEVNQISTLAGPGILFFWIVIAPICIRFLIGQSTRCTNCRRSFAISKGRRIITGERQIWKRETISRSEELGGDYQDNVPYNQIEGVQYYECDFCENVYGENFTSESKS